MLMSRRFAWEFSLTERYNRPTGREQGHFKSPIRGMNIKLERYMNSVTLDRRSESRTPVDVCTSIQVGDAFSGRRPVQLVDLSIGGAGLLATPQNAPRIGQTIHMELRANAEPRPSRVTSSVTRPGVVVNTTQVGRDMSRVGVRFLRDRIQAPFASSALNQCIDSRKKTCE